MRTLIPLALAALLTVAPASAQDESPACPDGQVETPEGCSDQAWIDPADCPPEHMCAAGNPGSTQSYGNESCIDCSGPVDEPVQYGNESCIDCTSIPPDPQTCMDGADEGETCLEDVQYLGGPGSVPASDDDLETAADGADADAKDAPALPAILLLAAIGALVLVARRQ
jgi:hypothetical protein